MWATLSTTAPSSTTSRTGSGLASSRVRVSSFSLMRVSRSASSPMSATNSFTVSMSTFSVWRMESVSRRMDASGVLSSWDASDTNRRRASSVVWSRPVSWLNSSASWPSSSRLRIWMRWLYSPCRTVRMARSSWPTFRVSALLSTSDISSDTPPMIEGDVPQVGLDGQQQRRLLRVVFIEVHRAQRHAPVHHRHRRPAAEGPLPVLRPEHVPAVQRRRDLAQQGVVVHGGCRSPTCRTGSARRRPSPQMRVADSSSSSSTACSTPSAVRVSGHAQRRADGQRLPPQGGLLGLEHHLLSHEQRVGVQQDEYQRDEQQIGQHILRLDAVPQGRPARRRPFLRSFRRFFRCFSHFFRQFRRSFLPFPRRFFCVFSS